MLYLLLIFPFCLLPYSELHIFLQSLLFHILITFFLFYCFVIFQSTHSFGKAFFLLFRFLFSQTPFVLVYLYIQFFDLSFSLSLFHLPLSLSHFLCFFLIILSYIFSLSFSMCLFRHSYIHFLSLSLSHSFTSSLSLSFFLILSFFSLSSAHTFKKI